MTINNKIKELLEEVLVFDIETSSFDKNGNPISIKNFDEYVKHAKVKWVGVYSYKYKKEFYYNALTQRSDIISIFAEHKTYVGVNNEAFDTEIMKNNGLITNKYYRQIDLQVVLGNNTHQGHKRRAEYMGVELKPVFIDGVEYGENSMVSLAHHFGVEMLKGDIDYKIFHKNVWNEEETYEIIKYLRNDVLITKQLFDLTVDFWWIFTNWLYDKHIEDWSWIRKSIASLTYISDCKVLGEEPTYKEGKDEPEEMGGRAIEPIEEELWDVHYLDEASKYPHTFAEFNLFNEVDVSGMSQEEIDEKIRKGELWHGNEKFKVKGYYDIREQGPLEKDIITKLITRFAIKRVLKNIKDGVLQIPIPDVLKDIITSQELSKADIKLLKGLQYAIKILLNSNYGAARSPIFEKIFSPNAGWDCCWIGQQVHEYMQKHFESYGYTIVGGFTDSWFFKSKPGDTKERIKEIANECMTELKKFMPFPTDSHISDYEMKMDYLLYYYDRDKKRYLKNNYCYISGDKVKIVGFPIMKNNATRLSMKLFEEHLKPLGLKNKRLKFEREFIEKLIKEELNKDISLASITWKVNPFDTYKNPNQIQAQISKIHLDGDGGRVRLIKNTRLGSVGKDDKYCTIDDADKLVFDDIVLEKVWKELEPFIIFKEQPKLDSYFDMEDKKKSSDDDLFEKCVTAPKTIKEKKWF